MSLWRGLGGGWLESLFGWRGLAGAGQSWSGWDGEKAEVSGSMGNRGDQSLENVVSSEMWQGVPSTESQSPSCRIQRAVTFLPPPWRQGRRGDGVGIFRETQRYFDFVTLRRLVVALVSGGCNTIVFFILSLYLFGFPAQRRGSLLELILGHPLPISSFILPDPKREVAERPSNPLTP